MFIEINTDCFFLDACTFVWRHDARVASVSSGFGDSLTMKGVSGLKATEWKRYSREFEGPDVIIVEIGGMMRLSIADYQSRKVQYLDSKYCLLIMSFKQFFC